MTRPLEITPRPVPGFRSRFTLEPEGAAPNLPNLWQVANVMNERVVARIADPSELASASRLTYGRRLGLLAWIEPVEHFVRTLLVASAITFLLMTVAGRKLLKSSPKIQRPSPARRRPLGVQEQRIVMPHPGWRTIANAPHATPHAATTQAATTQAITTQASAAPQHARQTHSNDPLDPASWTCPFRVLGWAEPEAAAPRPMPARFQNLLASMREQSRDPHLPPPAPLLPDTRDAPSKARPSKSGRAFRLARRLETIGRVLANPERHIMRIARYIASLPAGVLTEDTPRASSPHWRQGRETYHHALRLLTRAITALNACVANDCERHDTS